MLVNRETAGWGEIRREPIANNIHIQDMGTRYLHAQTACVFWLATESSASQIKLVMLIINRFNRKIDFLLFKNRFFTSD